MRGPYITASALIEALEQVRPGHLLIKNKAGNLAIMDEGGDFVGWVDLAFGETKYERDEDDE